ncbi:hypothetical protein [Saccharomonospora iraqiensis]|uniref:hypothetical protein n=1 Tax=Saccharomonospora iraqiensis TaxID=52698 RepID=UPI00022DF8EC|nr:hypothetical protein [Saccharomonospora iraqiensis]
MPPLTGKVLGVAAVTGLLILLGAWWTGASLFGAPPADRHRIVEATVTAPAECSDPDAVETVRFEGRAGQRDGRLSGCGHDEGEQVRVAVPPESSTGGGSVDVRLAATAPGTSDLRRPVGMALLMLSCAGGGTYAYLMARGPKPALA